MNPKTLKPQLTALADETRLRMLETLARSPEPIAVASLASVLTISESMASHHIRVLHSQGLVARGSLGRFVFYALDVKVFYELILHLKEISDIAIETTELTNLTTSKEINDESPRDTGSPSEVPDHGEAWDGENTPSDDGRGEGPDH